MQSNKGVENLKYLGKKIEYPKFDEKFLYGSIVEWNFRENITFDHNKYCYRFILKFENGSTVSKQIGGFNTKKEALKNKEYTISLLCNKKYIAFDFKLKTFLDFWFYYYKIQIQKITYNTFCTYRNVIYNYILPVLSEIKLSNITSSDITKLMKKNTNKNISRHIKTIILQSFEYARTHGYMNTTPEVIAFKNISKLSKKNTLKNKQNNNIYNWPDKKRPVLSLDKVLFLLNKCKEIKPDLYIVLLIAVTTGTRISETLGLKFSDVNFFKKELNVSRQIGRSMDDKGLDSQLLYSQEIPTKSKNGIRTIPIPDFLLDEIVLQCKNYEIKKESNPDFNDLDFIIFSDNGKPYTRSKVGKEFRELLKECSFESIHWHDLRHTYATLLNSADNKISLKAISLALGHYSPNFTNEVYIEAEVCDISIYMNKYINNIIEEISDCNNKDYEILDISKYAINIR